jgi:hypothetical protein
MPLYQARDGQFVILTPIGLSQKAAHIRRNPHVSLLYSDPTGSGLAGPPAVLVQGLAEAPDTITVSAAQLGAQLQSDMEAQARRLLRLQPGTALYLSNPLARYLMDWYFMRLVIRVKPVRVRWWERGDFSAEPHTLEVRHVA